MTQNEKYQIKRRTLRRDFWQRLCGSPDLPLKLLFVALYFIGVVFVGSRQAAWRTLVGSMELLSPLLKAAMEHAVTAYLFVGGLALLTLLLYPFGRRAAKDQLQCIGLINHAGMSQYDHIILSMRGMPSVDVSGAQAMLELCESLKSQGKTVACCGMTEAVRTYFDRAGITELLGEESYFWSADQAILDLLDAEIVE